MVLIIVKVWRKIFNNPERIFSRQWSIRAKWKHRYFNEMKHEVNERLDISSRVSEIIVINLTYLWKQLVTAIFSRKCLLY